MTIRIGKRTASACGKGMTSNINGVAIRANEPIAAPFATPNKITAGAVNAKKAKL